jgi:hypothetical protein
MAENAVKSRAGRPKGSKDKSGIPRTLDKDILKISQDWSLYLSWIGSNYRLEYAQHSVPFNIKLKMLEHPQLKAAVMMTQGLIAQAQWEWECKGNPEIAEYANLVFSPHWWDIAGIIVAAKNFGFAPCEKIFQVENWSGWGDAVSYREIKYVNPSTVQMWTDMNGRYAGFSQPVLNVKERVGTDKTFWFVHNSKQAILKHNPYWGWPDLDKGCYDYWYSNVILWQMFLRYIDRMGPFLFGFAPNITSRFKKSDGTYENYNLFEYLHLVMNEIKGQSVVTTPYKESNSGKQTVDIKYLEATKRASEFILALQASAEGLLYSYLTPPAIFQKPSTTVGSYALVDAHVSLYIRYLSGFILSEAIPQIEKNLIHPLVRMQYGDNAPLPKLRLSLFSDAEKKMMADEILLCIRSGQLIINAEETLRRLGLPIPDQTNQGKEIRGDGHENRIPGEKSPDRIAEAV